MPFWTSVWMVPAAEVGSIAERREGREKLSNTSVAFGPDGEMLGVYRKIHMFDVEVEGLVYRESEAQEGGDEPVVVRGEGWPVGLTVCYDVRFPELYRILARKGSHRQKTFDEQLPDLLMTMGASLRAGHTFRQSMQAVVEEGQDPASKEFKQVLLETGIGRPSYGRSLIVDPWGIVLAQAPDEETVISAELDRARLQDIREKLPSLKNRQADAYRWPTLA